MRSVYDAIKFSQAVSPTNATGTPTSNAIDTFGYNTAVFHVEIGTYGPAGGTPTSVSVAAKVQECATSNGTYTDVSGATADATTGTNKSAQIRVEGLGTSRLRYLKIAITPTFTGGTSPTVNLSCVAALGRGFKEPVDNSATPA